MSDSVLIIELALPSGDDTSPLIIAASEQETRLAKSILFYIHSEHFSPIAINGRAP